MALTVDRSISTARSQMPRRLPRDIPRFVLLCVLSVIFLAPIYWMVSTSLKTESDAIAVPVQFVPARPTLENYRTVLTSSDANVGRWTLNSVIVAVAYTVAHLLVCVLTAFPLARMRFRGRDAWFWVILGSLTIPGIVTLVPSYIMMIQFNWVDTFHALIWPGVPAVFGVFMLRQFFSGIPLSIEEAARIDGANSLQVLRHVILPLSVPALVTLGIFSFMGSWNNFVWPLFVANGPDVRTLPVGLTLFSSQYITEYAKMMAATALSSIPVLIAYLLAQRYLVQGIALTGMKE
jgi:multiple sugar transport system permease protein